MAESTTRVHDDDLDGYFEELFGGRESAPEPWHRARWRETASDAQRHVLDLLRRAGEHGLSTLDLIAACGPSAQARVGELVDMGWQVETRHGGSVAVYVLVSTELSPVKWCTKASGFSSMAVLG